MSTRNYASKRIGIIGAGIAGLHLGLRLQKLGIDCTIITDRTPDQVASAPLTNIVVHWPTTLRRERVLGVRHWPAEMFGFRTHRNVIRTSEPIDIRTRTRQAARGIDYRIYLPRLMRDFAERGGDLEVRPLDAKDIGRIAERFDLVAVAMPGNGFKDLFPRDAINTPYDRPQRYWLAGLYQGFRSADDRGVTVSITPDHGEALAFPFLSRTGMVTALAISSDRADELEILRILSSWPHSAGFCKALLYKLEQFHPAIYEQIDTARFGLQDLRDLAQVAVTPVVRHPYVELGAGKYAIALGDAHVTVDPLLAQGANLGSYSAFALADAIVESREFDLGFCREVERVRSPRILGASHWTNAFLQPPDETRIELMAAMGRDQGLTDEFFDNFNQPERQWQRVGSAEAIQSWLNERRMSSNLANSDLAIRQRSA